MNTIKKIGFGFSATVYLVVLLSAALLSLAPARVASAAAGKDDLCIPPIRELNNDYSVETGSQQGDGKGEHFDQGGAGWLTVNVINRATFKISFNPDGKKCEKPNIDLKFISSSDKTGIFKSLVDGTFTDADTGDGNWDFIKGAGGDTKDDSVIDNFRSFGVADIFSGNDKPISVAAFRQAVDHSELILSFENNKLDGIADCTGGGDGGSNFVLRRDGQTFRWTCEFDEETGEEKINEGWTGLTLHQGAYANPENFNITYNVKGGGRSTIIEHVSPNERGTRTFSWCGALGEFRSEDCKGPLYFEKSVTPESLASSSTKITTLNMRKDGDSRTLGVSVSGSATPSAAESTTTKTDDLTGEPTCETIDVSALAWISCPLFNIANTLASWLIGLFEDQLSFRVETGLGNADARSRVQLAWGLIKNLATAILVLVMLVMVVSQAIGTGWFEAYTVKKILPRLVFAAIFMQLSWYVLAFFVGIMDDLGKSIQAIMYAPFGGIKAMSLAELLPNASIGSGKQIAINWIATIGALGIGVAALPAVLALIVGAIFAVLTGLMVLVFRKILIIMALILAPIAILAWIMPATKRYWDLWWDNFLKALLMFPIAMAIIAAGRVFAYIVGTQSNTQFLNLILIMIGVFGPLFILPKTFKWGGSVMSMAGNTINSTLKPISDKASSGARGYGERWQARQANKLDYTQTGKKAFLRRGLLRTASGNVIPTKRNRKVALQQAAKWANEENEIAGAFADNIYKKALESDYQDRNADGSAKFEIDDAGNFVLNDKGEKIPVMLKGVAAAKQALVDISHHKDKRIAKAAITQLVQTSSWPEIQSAVGANGKRVYEDNKNWTETLAKDPDVYSRVLKSRVDTASHIVERAEKKAATSESMDAELDAMGVDAAHRAELKSNPTLFKNLVQMHYAIKEQMNNEDLTSQSEGFWEEANKLANGAGGQAISKALQDKLAGISKTGTAGQQILGHLAGGSLQAKVDGILGGAHEVTRPDGSKTLAPNNPDAIDYYLELAKGGTPVGSPVAPGPTVRPPTEGELTEEDVPIEHGPEPPRP